MADIVGLTAIAFVFLISYLLSVKLNITKFINRSKYKNFNYFNWSLCPHLTR